MAGQPFIVRPVDRPTARRWCADHPHAGTLPNSSRYYLAAYLNGRPAGLAVWGWGIRPRETPVHLFGEAGRIEDYLELCRFFVYDWCPANTASRFLGVSHRLLHRYAPQVKWLYTYAAGFQGLVGTIYQAANYEYIGRVLCKAFTYVPGRGLVHNISLFHRYGHICGSNDKSLREFQRFIPEARRWCGYNFRYIFWLCDRAERARLLSHATFTTGAPYPTTDDVEVWLENIDGTRVDVSPALAKSVPIVKLRSARAGSKANVAPRFHRGEGGVTPTPALHPSTPPVP
jgi:hypothetical protein